MTKTKLAEKQPAAKGKVTKEALLAATTPAPTVTKKAKEPKAPRETVAMFMKNMIMEGTHKDIDIYHATVEHFPQWAGTDREYYVAWYRWDLRRKGTQNVPDAIEPISKRQAKVKKEPIETVKVKKGTFTHRGPVPAGTTAPKVKEPLEGKAALDFLASLPKPTVSKAHNRA
jgi:hypothetical protein